MSVRPLLPASSTPILHSSLSRLSASSRSHLPPPPTHQQTRHITLPHPALTNLPPLTSPHIQIRSTARIPTILHALSILRAVEKQLGSPVIDVQLALDPDTSLPLNQLRLTLLRPVHIPKDILLEVPNPKTTTSDYLGGPSLVDVQNVLRGDPFTSGSGGDSQPMQIRVMIAKYPVRNPRSSSSAQKRSSVGTYEKRRGVDEAERKEDLEILEKLKEFGDGFFGGFKGVAERFEHLRKSGERDGGSESELGLQGGSDLTLLSDRGERRSLLDLLRVERSQTPSSPVIRSRPFDDPESPLSSSSSSSATHDTIMSPRQARTRDAGKVSKASSSENPERARRLEMAKKRLIAQDEEARQAVEQDSADERDAAMLGGVEGSEHSIQVEEMGGGVREVSGVEQLREERRNKQIGGQAEVEGEGKEEGNRNGGVLGWFKR